MACNLTPKQADDYFNDPEKGKQRQAAIWDKAIDTYIKNGQDLDKTLDGVSSETGLPRESLQKILRPQGPAKATTNEMWARQNARRQIGLQNQRIADAAGTGKFAKALQAYDASTRKITTFGHHTVFGKTHGGDNLWTNPLAYAKNFYESVKLTSLPKSARREAVMAEHEADMSDMRGTTIVGPDGVENAYTLAQRSKLDVTSRSEASSILGGGKSPLAHAAFEKLQMRRFEEWNRRMNKLSPEERTAANGADIARVVNNKWGGGAPGRIGGLFGRILFGPRLTPAQWRAAFTDPALAVYHGILDRSNATPGQLMAARMVGRRFATLLGAYGTTLALEHLAVQAGLIDKRNEPSFNPADTGNFMRLKILGKGVPLSPTIELLSLPIKMIYSALNAKPNERPALKFLEPLLNYGLFRLSPGISLATQLATGQELFSGRQLPDKINIRYWTGTLPKETTKKGEPTMRSITHPKLTYTEFLGERLPIPVAVFVRDAYDEMRAQGIDHSNARTLLMGALAASTVGSTGYEWHPDVPTPYKQAEQRTPENASDKQRAAILRRAMQDFRRTNRAQPKPKEAFGLGQ